MINHHSHPVRGRAKRSRRCFAISKHDLARPRPVIRPQSDEQARSADRVCRDTLVRQRLHEHLEHGRAGTAGQKDTARKVWRRRRRGVLRISNPCKDSCDALLAQDSQGFPDGPGQDQDPRGKSRRTRDRSFLRSSNLALLRRGVI